MSGPFSHKNHKRLKRSCSDGGNCCTALRQHSDQLSKYSYICGIPHCMRSTCEINGDVYSRVIVQYSQFASGVTEEGVGPPRVIQVVDCACYQDRSNLASFPPILWGRYVQYIRQAHSTCNIQYKQYILYIQYIHTVYKVHPFVFPVNIKYTQSTQYTQYKQYTQYTQYTM